MHGFKATTFAECPSYWKNYTDHQTKKYKLTWANNWLKDFTLIKNVAMEDYNAKIICYEDGEDNVIFPDEETFLQFKLAWA